MAEQLPKEKTVTVHDLLVSQSYEIAALINVLEKNGLVTKTDILNEIRRLKPQ